MLMIAGLMALVGIGMAVDFSSGGGQALPDDDDTLPTDEDLPRSMPGISDVSNFSEGGDTGEELPGTASTGQTLTGGEGADFLMGGANSDTITGGGGADDLRGGQGADSIMGGDGDDWIQGEGDYGIGGDDEIHGGAGNDSLAGQGGNDLIWGDEGDDTLLGGDGDDTLFGGPGNDWLSGNAGDDLLVSGGGADDLDGGKGNDTLIGSDDAQTAFLRGGEGDDILMPGAGDFAEGLEGADSFVLKQVDGAIPTVADFDAQEDRVILHLPESMADDARLDLQEDQDGTSVLSVNGQPVARFLQVGGLQTRDIAIQRLPG